MASILIHDARSLGKRIPPNSFARRLRTAISARIAPLAARIAFVSLLAAFLYSITATLSVASEPASRLWQSLASIRTTAEQYVRDNAASTGNVISLTITPGELDARLALAPCTTNLTAFTLNSAPIAARTTVGVRCAANPEQDLSSNKAANVEWTVYVPVTVESEIDVLVLRNSMPRDAHVAPGDFEVQRRRVPGFGAAYITNTATLRDQHLKRSIPAGTPIMADMMSRDLIIKRGQQVVLIYDAGGLAVQAPGMALADGGTADRIRVQNQTSLKIVEGVVESGNLVRVGM